MNQHVIDALVGVREWVGPIAEADNPRQQAYANGFCDGLRYSLGLIQLPKKFRNPPEKKRSCPHCGSSCGG